jgi:hypothetical protein
MLFGSIVAIAETCSTVSAVIAARLTVRRGRFKLWFSLSTVATAVVYVPQYGIVSMNQLYVTAVVFVLAGFAVARLISAPSRRED